MMSHAEIVKRYNVPGACNVRIADWPYDCKAKDLYPEHVVYICDEHRVWWHEADHQPPDLDVCDSLRDGNPVASIIPGWIQTACDRCTQGVMDATNSHYLGLCSCDCHAC